MNTGELDFDTFYRAIEKIGIIIEKDSLSHLFFNYYDKDKNGKLNYKNWAKSVVDQSGYDRPATTYYSPSKAGVVSPGKESPAVMRSGLNSQGFPLSGGSEFYQQPANAARSSITNEQFFHEAAR